MDFLVSANTDKGIVKATNQDSASVKIINTRKGRMVFAIVCDGMGGLEKGEVASATVVRAFENWITTDLPALCNQEINDYVLREQWNRIVQEQNLKLKTFGTRQGIKLGTTIVAMLLTQNRYYVLNVGDSRAYIINKNIRQITFDQTFVAREVANGNMTEEQARSDPRRSVLLQCVGASDTIHIDMFCGDIEPNSIYMLCSDGFRHEITNQEIFDNLSPHILTTRQMLDKSSLELIDLNKKRMEKDNITVVLVKVF